VLLLWDGRGREERGKWNIPLLGFLNSCIKATVFYVDIN